MSESELWVMPDWMEPYRAFICNTGGNPVEEMVNGNANTFSNLPLSTLQACVKSQVVLLSSLHAAGLIGHHNVEAMAAISKSSYRRVVGGQRLMAVKKLHPRVMVVQKALVQVAEIVNAVVAQHDLTVAEIVYILGEQLMGYNKSAIRDERLEPEDDPLTNASVNQDVGW